MEGLLSTLTFLDIELDTQAQACRLPLGKLFQLCKRLKGLIIKKVTLKELQEIVGHFNFACRVVASGRAFFCRLCDAMRGPWQPLHRTWVIRVMRRDLLVRSSFLDGFNGVFIWRTVICLGADFQVQTDASGSHGYGIYFKGR